MKKPFRNRGKSDAGAKPIVKESPASDNNPKHVVVVMDGMRGFTTETLKWALENLIPAGCTVTLLGVMPYLNIPLSTKTWLDVWTVELEDSMVVGGQAITEEWRNDVKYLKLKAAFDLCKKHGVVPHKEVVMGCPQRLRVVEKITSLHATCVVFDRHLRKNIEFYMERIPCKMVMMNQNGGGIMIKSRSLASSPVIDSLRSSPTQSPTPTVAFLISELLRRILEQRSSDEDDYDKDPGMPRFSI
ncbi:uncharacterized protein LOC116206646 [Punica granatum]|uniref:Uncharacterized protein n=2 Tax=Punica granatum TaxID=22663 RepID=A0A2I0JNN5_PUNGR|nr:uncharacterized protein LOC116206646 [Punica granatum]PKI57126.1 hypothetical protein CRG98_022416 [Punica granatum]